MISLNLLPPERKQSLAGKRRNRRVSVVGALFVSLLLLATVVLFGASLYVGTVVSAQKNRIEQTREDLKRFEDIEQLTLAIRDRVTVLSTQEKTRQLWSKIAEDLSAVIPPGIKLSQTSLTTSSTPHVQLSGQADNKEKVASLRERLEQSDRFEQATIRQIGQTEDKNGNPIATFSLETNLTGVAPPTPAARPKGVGE